MMISSSYIGVWNARASWNSYNEWSHNGIRFHISGNLLAYFSNFFKHKTVKNMCFSNELFMDFCQSKARAVVIDFTDPTTVYDNVKQVQYPWEQSYVLNTKFNIWRLHSAFVQSLGNSIWHEKRRLCATDYDWDSISIISILWESQHGEHRVRYYLAFQYSFCFPCSTLASFVSKLQLLYVHFIALHSCQGCLVAPTLSIGSILLQQAAISASFHYKNVEIVESRATARVR